MSTTIQFIAMHLARLQGSNARQSDRGASLVEYALLVALIAVVCIAAVAVFGGATSDTFSRVGNSVSGT